MTALLEVAPLELRGGVEVSLLGPIAAWSDDAAIALGGPKDRAVLAQLALAGGRVVTEGALIDGIWGEEPPARASKAVQNQVLRVRKAVRAVTDASVIVTEPCGYRIAVPTCRVDVERAEALIEEARGLTHLGRHAEASRVLTDALAHWRGEPLADLAALPFAAAASTRLAELRWVALEERIEADLRCGRHHALVAELHQAVHDAPLRECLWGQLMMALYRSGRQAEALRVFQDLRARLDHELGLAPGEELLTIERAIATGDLPLAGHPGRAPTDRRPEERVEALRRVSLFEDLDDAALRDVSEALTATQVDAGEVLIRAGETGHDAFVVVSGEADVVIGERTMATLGPGEIIGEMALLDGSPRVATVVARTPMHLLVLGRRALGDLLDEQAVAVRLLSAVVARLRSVELDEPVR